MNLEYYNKLRDCCRWAKVSTKGKVPELIARIKEVGWEVPEPTEIMETRVKGTWMVEIATQQLQKNELLLDLLQVTKVANEMLPTCAKAAIPEGLEESLTAKIESNKQFIAEGHALLAQVEEMKKKYNLV